MSVRFDRKHNDQKTPISDRRESSEDNKIVRRYQIKANVVNVYHSLTSDDTKYGIDLTKNNIQFDSDLNFETKEQIFIPFSEVD